MSDIIYHIIIFVPKQIHIFEHAQTVKYWFITQFGWGWLCDVTYMAIELMFLKVIVSVFIKKSAVHETILWHSDNDLI